MNKVWALDDSLKLIRAIQQESRKYGYHLTLGGSVLNDGRSEKDLDLYFLPLDNPKMPTSDPKALLTWLTTLWGKYQPLGGAEYEDPAAKPLNRFVIGGARKPPLAPVAWQPEREDGRIEVNFGEPPRLEDLVFDPVVGLKQKYADIFSAPTPATTYKYKVLFLRPGGDRIDVFVL